MQVLCKFGWVIYPGAEERCVCHTFCEPRKPEPLLKILIFFPAAAGTGQARGG